MKIYCLIVCYKPDAAKLRRICEKLIANSASVVLVDNTEESYLANIADAVDCTIIALNDNTGIAHAQNVGIKLAIKRGADVIVFFDQDSEVENDFLLSLLAPLKLGEPGVVSPLYFDSAKGFEFPSMTLSKFGLSGRTYSEQKSPPYSVDVVISSGTAATTVTFEIAGLMDEDFYIDFVDTEWCLRCRSKNIPIQIVPSAVMKHSIGSKTIDLKFMKLFVHSPVRCYYQIRNCFILFRKESVPFTLALRETLTVLTHRLILLLFVTGRMHYLHNYCLAFIHGIRGVVGRKPS